MELVILAVLESVKYIAPPYAMNYRTEMTNIQPKVELKKHRVRVAFVERAIIILEQAIANARKKQERRGGKRLLDSSRIEKC